MDIFAGTAEYYDQFRPGIPDTLRDYVLKAAPAPVTLLDLGTGTGRVLEQFAPYFSDIIAVEPSEEMLKAAHRRLMQYPGTFVHASAEDMELPDDWHASLVTVCRAFHWMDRAVVLARLDKIVAPRGVVAVFYEHTFWTQSTHWADLVRETLQHFLGPERETLGGAYHEPAQPFSQDFARSAFSHVDKRIFPITRTWNADQIVGYLYSTSYASKQVLGAQAGRFEEQLRRGLAQLSPQDMFTENNEFELFLARRP
ncbi:MAG TPA: class I SAM-dependent methyltransferase [Candidatus Saccharimonadales bacterium]|nr:class I SAM-dependent methyltransferase [Candidatus Saccharimonadales bacterium]